MTKIELEILFKVHVTDTSIHFINTFYAEFFLTDVIDIKVINLYLTPCTNFEESESK